MEQIGISVVIASPSPSSSGAAALSPAALVPLFAPYLEALGPALEPALATLLRGMVCGQRSLADGRAHSYELSWSGVLAPLETCQCQLRFPQTPSVQYSFALPVWQLLVWLAPMGGDSQPQDLPDGFWRWLILGEVPAEAQAQPCGVDPAF